MSNYSYTKQVNTSFDEAISNITESLKQEGFWILTTIDIKEKIKEKLGKDIEEYVILWACNPPLAYQALQEEIEIWLLLPCNVIVYKKEGNVFVSAVVPTKAMAVVSNDKLANVAQEAEEKLKRAVDSMV